MNLETRIELHDAKYLIEKLPWYIRFCLLFCKLQYSCDWAHEPGFQENGIFWKKLFGKIYIVDME